MATDQVLTRTFTRSTRITETWSLAGTKVYLDETLQLDLADVHGGHWADYRAGGRRPVVAANLELRSDTTRVRVTCGTRTMDANQQRMREFASAVLMQLEAVRPGTRIHIDGAKKAAILWFVVGIALILFGVSRLLLAAAPVLGLILVFFGLLLAVPHNPWTFDRKALSAGAASVLVRKR